MNTLSFGLLAMLTGSPRTGYELAKLEQSGYVQFVPVAQKEKPDKKIYSITEQGLAKVREWIPGATDEPVKRDELLLKVYCMALADPATARSLIQDRITLFASLLERHTNKLAQFNGVKGQPAFTSPGFGHYILLQRAVSNSQAELDWCDWVLGLLPPDPLNSNNAQH